MHGKLANTAEVLWKLRNKRRIWLLPNQKIQKTVFGMRLDKTKSLYPDAHQLSRAEVSDAEIFCQKSAIFDIWGLKNHSLI